MLGGHRTIANVKGNDITHYGIWIFNHGHGHAWSCQAWTCRGPDWKVEMHHRLLLAPSFALVGDIRIVSIKTHSVTHIAIVYILHSALCKENARKTRGDYRQRREADRGHELTHKAVNSKNVHAESRESVQGDEKDDRESQRTTISKDKYTRWPGYACTSIRTAVGPGVVQFRLLYSGINNDQCDQVLTCHLVYSHIIAQLTTLALVSLDVGRPFMTAAIQSRRLFSYPPAQPIHKRRSHR